MHNCARLFPQSKAAENGQIILEMTLILSREAAQTAWPQKLQAYGCFPLSKKVSFFLR